LELVWKGILYRTLKHLFYIIVCDFNFCGPGLTAEITSYTVYLKVKITRIPIDLQKIEQFSHLLWHSKSHTAPYNMWKIARPRPINIITISRSVTKNCWKKNQNKNNRYFFILLVLRSNSLFVKQQVDLFLHIVIFTKYYSCYLYSYDMAINKNTHCTCLFIQNNQHKQILVFSK
jgi:hypothetical protein